MYPHSSFCNGLHLHPAQSLSWWICWRLLNLQDNTYWYITATTVLEWYRSLDNYLQESLTSESLATTFPLNNVLEVLELLISKVRRAFTLNFFCLTYFCITNSIQCQSKTMADLLYSIQESIARQRVDPIPGRYRILHLAGRLLQLWELSHRKVILSVNYFHVYQIIFCDFFGMHIH